MSTDMAYIHPHSESRIIDNAVLTVTSTGLSNKFVALEAEKGMPNEATYISSTSEYTFTLGEPNYSKFGQSGLNAIQWLRAGGGLWVIRVVPDDETFASISLGIGFRADEQYTNDEEEYVTIELTNAQFKLHNLKTESEKDKYAKGESNDKSIILPKYYVLEGGNTEPSIKNGMMTLDEIEIYAIESGAEFKGIAETIPQEAVPAGQVYACAAKIESVCRDAYLYAKNLTIASEEMAAAFVEGGEGSGSGSGTGEVSFIYPGDYPNTVLEINKYAIVSDGVAWGEDTVSKKATAFNKAASIPGAKVYPYSINLRYMFADGTLEDFETELNEMVLAEDAQADLAVETVLGYDKNNDAVLFSDIGGDETSEKAYGYYSYFAKQFDKAMLAQEPAETRFEVRPGMTSDAWAVTYEAYKLDMVEGIYTSVPASKIGVSAMTEKEAEAWNIQSGLKVILGNDDILKTVTNANFVVTEPSTGAYERVRTFPVTNASNGNVIYSTSMTQLEADLFNFNHDDLHQVELGNPVEQDPGTYLKSQYNKVLQVLDTNITFATEEKVTFEGISENETKAFNAACAYLANVGVFATNAVDGNDIFTIEAGAIDSDTNLADVTVKINPKGSLTAEFYGSLDSETKAKFVAKALEEGEEEKAPTYILNTDIQTIPDMLKGDKEVTATFSVVAMANEIVELNNGEITFTLGENTETLIVAGGKFSVNITKLPSNFAVSLKLNIQSDELTNAILKAADAADAVSKGSLAFKASKTGEYLSYPELSVENYEETKLEPNANYIERSYDAIGFVTTQYTKYSLQSGIYTQFYEDEGILKERSAVAEQYANAKKGYGVSATRDVIDTLDKASLKIPGNCFAEFARFLPKGSGKWYNRLSISLAYDSSMDKTYTEWSMFKLTISETTESGDTARESFNVALDPDAISSSKESLFIEDVVNRYSKYLTCVVNYDNLANFIEAKLPIVDADGNPVADEDGNEFVVDVDTAVKYIWNQINLDEFNKRIFGDDYLTTEYSLYAFTSLMSAIGYDADLCHLDTTLQSSAGEFIIPQYVEPFVSMYLFNTVTSSGNLYIGGGSSGNGWGYEYETDDGEMRTTSTLEQALVRAYNGTTDQLITNPNLCVFDLVLDCNYPVIVKTAMSDLSAIIRQDCITILDQGISTANATQAINKRKNEMNYDTFYTSIFTQHLIINDEWSGKPVKVTPTFFLASKIPLNDTAYSEATNFVGPRRGTISGFTSISWMPTEPEKDQLYRNQVNYIERDTISTHFATELTTQTKNTPLSLIHPVRTLLKLQRAMLAVSRNYRSEFASPEVYGLLQTELNNVAATFVLAGGYEYITPVINTSDYDRQQRICRVDVDVAFTDIIERFAFNFIVNRT